MRLNLRKRVSGARPAGGAARTVADLGPGEGAVLERLDLPEEVARRLMELGFVPGHRVVAAHRAPGGDPRVYRVDGSEIALRRETACRLVLAQEGAGPAPAGDLPGAPQETR